MFCTTIIPTVGRTSLDRAIKSILDQEFPQAEHEIVVVNDSGAPLPFADWHEVECVKIINTQRRERSVARNVGAAVSRGAYLHFLDDDDWLLPGALEVLWNLAEKHKNCAWLYGGTNLFDRAEKPLHHLIHRLQPNCFTQVMAGEWIPLQASIIHQGAFHRVGGFNPLLTRFEDIDLARRIALIFDFHGTSKLIAGVGMGVENSTTDYKRSQLVSREARELILSHPEALRRMRSSAENSFWRGRIVRVYLTSSIWNITRMKFLTAVSRILYGLLAFLIFTPFQFSRYFWQAVSKPYESETFARGVLEQTKA